MKKEDIAAKQRRKNFEARPLGEENRIDLHPKGFTLFIDRGGEVKPYPIQNSNPKKASPCPRILGQPNQQKINCRCHTISVIMIRRDASYKF